MNVESYWIRIKRGIMKKETLYPHYNHGGGGNIVPEKSVLLPLFSGKVNVDCTCTDIAFNASFESSSSLAPLQRR